MGETMKKYVLVLMVSVLFLSITCPVAWAIDENVVDAKDNVTAMEQANLAGSQYVTLKNPGKEVFVKNRAGEWVPAQDGMVILPGDEVKTATGSSVEVILDGGQVGHITVREGSVFKILEASTNSATGDKKTLLDLAVGKILVKAEALKGNSKFEVKTPTAIAGVRGTLFEVEVDGSAKK